MITLVAPADIRLVMTCGACPEQYDAFLEDQAIGYLRLRHGYFSVQCPWGGETVYEKYTKGDGMFDDTHERTIELHKARCAIANWYNNRQMELRNITEQLEQEYHEEI